MKRVTGTQLFRLLLPLCLCLVFLFFAQRALLYERRERAVLPAARAAAAEFHVPLAMVLAVIAAESDFRPDAVSPAGAVGLMQLLPETFAFLQSEKLLGDAKSDLADPNVNIRYGTYYLSYLYARFGAWKTALAAYNAGEGRVCEWLEDETISPGGSLARIPFPETAAYVEKTLAAYDRYLQRYPE